MTPLIRLHQDIRFGRSGNDTGFLGAGWTAPGPDHRWIEGNTAQIRLIHPGNMPVLLQIDASLAQGTARQHVMVAANGATIGELDFTDSRPRALAIPAGQCPAGELLRLRLDLPDAEAATGGTGDRQTGTADSAPPAATRVLSVSRVLLYVHEKVAPDRRPGGTASAQPLPGDMARFIECTGQEFGEAWSKAGTPIRSLLPGAAIGFAALLRALENEFSGLGDRDQIDLLATSDGTIGAYNRRLDIAVRNLGLAGLDQNVQRDQAGLALRELRQEALRLLRAGGAIFVAATTLGEPPLQSADVLPLLTALNRYGRTIVLWLAEANEEHPPGTVERVLPGLLRGHVGQRPGQRGWVSICTNALALAKPWLDRPAPPRSAASERRRPPIGAQARAGSNLPAQKAAFPLAGPLAGLISPLQTLTGHATPPPGQTPTLPTETSLADPATARKDAPAPAAIEAGNVYPLLQDLTFGAGGNETACLGFGWSEAERGFRWTDGQEATLTIRHPGPHAAILLLAAWPYVQPPALPVQRLTLSSDNSLVASLPFPEASCYAVPFDPGPPPAHGQLTLTFTLHDAARPSDISKDADRRQLGLAVQRVSLHLLPPAAPRILPGTGGLDAAGAAARVGLALEDLPGQFENLGGGTGFAAMQAACGTQPLSLFGETPIPLAQLVLLIWNRLPDLGLFENLAAHLQPGEPVRYVIEDRAGGFHYVTDQTPAQIDEETLRRNHARRLRMLRETFLEDAAAAKKLYVYECPDAENPLAGNTMLALLLALRRHGPCTLLMVLPASAAHLPGTVEMHLPGLLHGYATHGDTRSWLEICVHALRLSAPDSK